MKAKKILAVLLAVAMTFSIAGCGKSDKNDENSTNNDSSNNVVNEGNDSNAGEKTTDLDGNQYYNTYLASDPTSLDVSLRSDSYSSTIISNVNEGLVRLEDRDGDYFMAPGDAQTWETSEDGKVWTFHLGDNKWSDGEPVTAQQYVYSLQRSAKPETGCPNGWFLTPVLNYDEISKGEKDVSELGVKAIDEKTLEITLSNVTPAFLEMCNGTIYYPQREDKVKEWGEKYGSEAEFTVYNGPFVLDSWTHNSALVLKKNPNYWNADAVKLDTVNLAVMQDTTTIINAYKSGDLDEVGVSTQEWLEEFKGDENSKYSNYTTQGLTFNFYNTKDKLFKNENIRKAFTLSINHEDINEMCFGGLRVPTYGWVVPTISVGETNFRKAAGDPILDQKAKLEADGETPKDLLIKGMEELGLGDDPSTLDVTLSLAGTSDWFRTYGEYLQQVYAEELGVNMKISFSEWAIFEPNIKNGNYQIAYMSWGAYYNDPYDVLSVFKSKWDQVGTGWVNEKYDELIDQGAIEMDAQKRLQNYIDAEKILMDEAIVCPLAAGTVNSFYQNYVYGYSSLGFSSNGFKDMYTMGR
ncbi:peptide ABC transporter substrate-binding protein [Sedimentibacter sp. zth1]|uniref:peptide ABC transporter substrate-binding protein n=1 Tax=Sedimentibacter sp. zth1 TaxID=2816908 RepID=UPI001A937730|nr:peptide ABC transporter substrate-binding protein [Sedimentibacter sp. zth1]QSX06162.1 peptide ABC transporter substrate-binding protein [Sedimentibacter sp. zth1]